MSLLFPDSCSWLSSSSFSEDTQFPHKLQNSLSFKVHFGYFHLLLLCVRVTNEAWYITAEGQVFNATGFVHKGKTYFTADCYVERELPAKSGPQEELAEKIADTLLKGEFIVEY